MVKSGLPVIVRLKTPAIMHIQMAMCHAWSYREERLGENRRMTPDSIRKVIVDILAVINPDNTDRLDIIDDEQPFREQLDLDSMDFLDIVLELRKRFRIQVPEDDYGELVTMSSTVAYLQPLMQDIHES
jgi:acyl carrier protein